MSPNIVFYPLLALVGYYAVKYIKSPAQKPSKASLKIDIWVKKYWWILLLIGLFCVAISGYGEISL